MTNLLDPIRMDMQRAEADAHWHATVLHGGMIASVVVVGEADGTWSVLTQLRDRSLHPLGDGCKCGGFATHAAALHAGQAASLRLHKALVGMHPVEPVRKNAWSAPPVGGYQSEALRRFVRAQQHVEEVGPSTIAPEPAAMVMMA